MNLYELFNLWSSYTYKQYLKCKHWFITTNKLNMIRVVSQSLCVLIKKHFAYAHNIRYVMLCYE